MSPKGEILINDLVESTELRAYNKLANNRKKLNYLFLFLWLSWPADYTTSFFCNNNKLT